MASKKLEPVEWPEEAPTKVICLACGGDHRRLTETVRGYRTTLCAWCSNGAMTPEQSMMWRNHLTSLTRQGTS